MKHVVPATVGAAHFERLRPYAFINDESSAKALFWLAALASAVAGVVHLRFAPAHAGEDVLYGVFFYATAACQLASAAVLVVARPRRSIARAVVAGNLAIVAMWVASRTVGPPVGAEAWTPEPIAYADAFCTGAELAAIVLVLAATRAAGSLRRSLRVFATVAAAAVLVPMTVAASPAAHTHGSGGGADDGHSHAPAAEPRRGAHIEKAPAMPANLKRRCKPMQVAPHAHAAGTGPHSHGKRC